MCEEIEYKSPAASIHCGILSFHDMLVLIIEYVVSKQILMTMIMITGYTRERERDRQTNRHGDRARERESTSAKVFYHMKLDYIHVNSIKFCTSRENSCHLSLSLSLSLCTSFETSRLNI